MMAQIELQGPHPECFVYNGPIVDEGFASILRMLRSLPKTEAKRSHVLLFLTTLGGDADAAFRIARVLAEVYERVTVYLAGKCKSAGTLIAIGAHELVISDAGELGPLDVQLKKPDELIQSSSGLDLQEAMAYLKGDSMDAFRRYTVDMAIGGGLSTKFAALMATKLTCGLYGRLYAQIDPIRIGEVLRANAIAIDYGDRLARVSKNMKPGAVERLVVSYHSHSFVIDLKEAKHLFENVRKPSEEELRLEEQLRDLIQDPIDDEVRLCYAEEENGSPGATVHAPPVHPPPPAHPSTGGRGTGPRPSPAGRRSAESRPSNGGEQDEEVHPPSGTPPRS